MKPTEWRVRLGHEAEVDFAKILRRTKDKFGAFQLDIYRVTLIEAVYALKLGPELLGSVSREELGPGLRTLHVARKGRRGRHFILYRTRPGDMIEVVRILHDAMDLPRHIPPDLD